MWVHALAIVGLALGCAAWVALGRWIAQRDPHLGNRVERSKGCCGAHRRGNCEGTGCRDRA